MSNVIQFLETLGSNSAQARFSNTQYAAAVASLDLEDAQRRALAGAMTCGASFSSRKPWNNPLETVERENLTAPAGLVTPPVP